MTIAVTADIACRPGALVTKTACRHQQVANLIAANNPDLLLLPGDLQYDVGALTAFNGSYDKAFGSLRPITRPVPGNHEYRTEGAAGYAAYFADNAPYWYSFDVGSWHVVALDSNCAKIGGCGGSTPQATWLKADLAANPAACTVAVWHHPKLSSGEYSGVSSMNWAWRILWNNRADVILNGHDHNYQRWQPTKYDRTADNVRGLVEFVVGTGGKSLYQTTPQPGLLATAITFGAAFLTLSDGSYSWEFKDESGAVLDEGSRSCH